MYKKTHIIAITLILFLVSLGIAGYIYWRNTQKLEAEREAIENAGQMTDDAIENATKGVLPPVTVNPLESKPDVNPADQANPFKDIKTNPFE